MKKFLVHIIPLFILSLVFSAAWLVNTTLKTHANAADCNPSDKCITGTSITNCSAQVPCTTGISSVTHEICTSTNKCITGRTITTCIAQVPCITGTFSLIHNSIKSSSGNGGEGEEGEEGEEGD